MLATSPLALQCLYTFLIHSIEFYKDQSLYFDATVSGIYIIIIYNIYKMEAYFRNSYSIFNIQIGLPALRSNFRRLSDQIPLYPCKPMYIWWSEKRINVWFNQKVFIKLKKHCNLAVKNNFNRMTKRRQNRSEFYSRNKW